MKEITQETLNEFDKKANKILIKWEIDYFEGYKTIEYTLINGKVKFKIVG